MPEALPTVRHQIGYWYTHLKNCIQRNSSSHHHLIHFCIYHEIPNEHLTGTCQCMKVEGFSDKLKMSSFFNLNNKNFKGEIYQRRISIRIHCQAYIAMLDYCGRMYLNQYVPVNFN